MWGRGGGVGVLGCVDSVGWGGGGGQKTIFCLPLRSITQPWPLHRTGCLATWHPLSPPSPGNESCDRNQPATSRLPYPPLPSPLCSSPVSNAAALAPSPASSSQIRALTLRCTCEFTPGGLLSGGRHRCIQNWFFVFFKQQKKGKR